jgi:hypothetical protein
LPEVSHVMRSTITLLAAAVAAGTVAAPAAADPAGCADQHLKRSYKRTYHRAAEALGKHAVGRHIVRDGATDRRPASCAEIGRSVRTLKRWLAPPAAPVLQGDRPPTAHVTAPARTGGQYAIPSSIVMCESGGDYGAVNQKSGAGGAYQILPSTWRAYGGSGSPQNASPAEQDRIAAKVWRGQGRGAWVC